MITNNKTVEARHQLIKQHREVALQALNKVMQVNPESQYHRGDWVWLKAKHLALPYASAKLAPKHHRPFKITKEVSPVAYQLELPRAWTIHDVFHSSLLTPYKETQEHGAQFQCPPPELIDNEEEYEVEDIINHRYHGKQCQLQFLICWKGYSAADDTWEPADQVHADQLVRRYHLKHEMSETRHKSKRQTKTKMTIHSIPLCPPSTQQISPLPLLQASPSTWTPPKPSPSGLKSTPQWSISRTPSPSQQQLWQPPMSLVSCSFPLNQCVLLLKDTAPLDKKNSSSSHKDWQELCKRIKKLAMTIKNNWKYSASKERIWQNMRHMQLIWKQPTSTGRLTLTGGTLTGKGRHKDQKGMRRTKDMSSISSSQSLTVTTPSMSLPSMSKWMDCTAWALSVSMSPSTSMSCFPLSISPSTKKGNFPIGSLKALPMTPHTLPCTTIPEPRRTGGLQLSSNNTMTCTLKLLPWSQSKGVWPLPSKLPRYSWTKASDTCLACMPMSDTSSSMPSMRAPTLTPSPRGSSLLAWAAHTMVWLNSSQRVMSQGSLQEGKRTARIGE